VIDEELSICETEQIFEDAFPAPQQEYNNVFSEAKRMPFTGEPKRK
jgi:hypothetical protein